MTSEISQRLERINRPDLRQLFNIAFLENADAASKAGAYAQLADTLAYDPSLLYDEGLSELAAQLITDQGRLTGLHMMISGFQGTEPAFRLRSQNLGRELTPEEQAKIVDNYIGLAQSRHTEEGVIIPDTSLFYKSMGLDRFKPEEFRQILPQQTN